MTPENILDPDPGGVMTPENIFDPGPGGVMTPEIFFEPDPGGVMTPEIFFGPTPAGSTGVTTPVGSNRGQPRLTPTPGRPRILALLLILVYRTIRLR